MNRAKRGFTLIELIIAVVIIGILAAIAAPIMSGIIEKTRWAEGVHVLGGTRTAVQAYIQEHLIAPHVLDGSGEGIIYLNGPRQTPNNGGISIEVPPWGPPMYFLYRVLTPPYNSGSSINPNQLYCVTVSHSTNTEGIAQGCDDSPGSDPIIAIDPDGTIRSYNAPKF